MGVPCALGQRRPLWGNFVIARSRRPLAILPLLAVLVSAMWAVPTPVAAATFTFPVLADAQVRSDNPTKNY
ncbi:MAG TPA: hypothetical protein VI076_11345, partial [Actinopolymorphaceae bacterium]